MIQGRFADASLPRRIDHKTAAREKSASCASTMRHSNSQDAVNTYQIVAHRWGNANQMQRGRLDDTKKGRYWRSTNANVLGPGGTRPCRRPTVPCLALAIRSGDAARNGENGAVEMRPRASRCGWREIDAGRQGRNVSSIRNNDADEALQC
jgi:hypothetical protein